MTDDRDASTLALVEELLQAVGPLMRRLRAESDPDGLSWSQVAVLGRLKRGGPAATADLARSEKVKPQSMGATMASLEREGLVARAAHPSDGRQFLYDLTAKGEEARLEYRQRKRTWLASAISALEAEDAAVLRSALPVLRRLAND